MFVTLELCRPTGKFCMVFERVYRGRWLVEKKQNNNFNTNVGHLLVETF